MVKVEGEKDYIDFGDYVKIEQVRYGVPNEKFIFKVVGRLQSNSWVDSPMQRPLNKTRHDYITDVLNVIQCGIDETEVVRVRLQDCEYIGTEN